MTRFSSVTRLACALSFLACASFHVQAAVNAWSSPGPDGGSAFQVEFHPTSAAKLYLAGLSGIYRSLDGGAHWELITDNLFSGWRHIAVDPSNGDRFFVTVFGGRFYSSNNGGVTLETHDSLPVVQAEATAFSADGSALYVISGGKFYRSTDHGVAWETRTPIPGAGWGDVGQLLVDPADPLTVVVPANQSLQVTRDGGATWQAASLPPSTRVSEFAFSRSGLQRLWAATGDGLFISSDLGSNWSPTPMSRYVSSVVTHPTDPRVLYVTAEGKLYRTEDEGLAWIELSAGMPFGQSRAVTISPSSPQHMVALGSQGPLISTDAGATWTPQYTGLKGSHIAGMSAAAASDRIYVATYPGGLFRFDGGTDVPVALDQDALLQPLLPADYGIGISSVVAQSLNPDRLFAMTGAGLLRSMDAGTSWNLIGLSSFGNNQPMKLVDSPADEDVMVATTPGGGLYRSANGGLNWSPVTGMPMDPYVYDVAMGTTASYATVWTSAPIGQPPVGQGVYKSTDDGSHWVPASGGIESIRVHSLAVDPTNNQRVYAGSSRGLIRTLDGGTSWADINWPDAQPTATNLVAVDPVNPYIVYAATGGRVGRSIDGGTSWESLRTAAQQPNWSPSSILVDPQRPSTLLLGTHYNGLKQISIAPDLSLEAAASGATLPVGARANRRYTLRNLGPFHATHPRLALTIPATATDVTASLTGASGSCTQSAPNVVCTLESLRAGFSALVEVSFVQPTAGTFTLPVRLTADQPDPVALNNAADTTLVVDAVGNLAVALSGPTSASAGDALSYTFTVTNSGPSDAAETTATWQLPAGFTASSVTASRGTCTMDAASVHCVLGTLQSSATIAVTVSATAPGTGSYLHNITVRSITSDSDASNNTAALTTVVAAAPAPAPIPPPPPTDAGGGGGGGSLSLLSLLLLLGLSRMRHGTRRRGMS